MKIRSKLLIAFTLSFLFLLLTITLLGNWILRDRALKEQTTRYAELTKQISIHCDYLTDDVEHALFNLYSSSYLLDHLAEKEDTVSRSNRINTEMRWLCGNSSPFSSFAVLDLQGNAYVSYKDVSESTAKQMEKLADREFFSVEGNNRWLVDENGGLYLKKDLYSSMPLTYYGTIAAEVDKDHLRSAFGMTGHKNGSILILDGAKNLILAEETMEPGLFQELREFLADGDFPGSAAFSFGGVEYCAVMQSSPGGSWSVVQLMPMKEVMSLSASILKTNLFIGVLALLAAVLLSYLIASSITKNVDILLGDIKKVSAGDWEITPHIHSRDEIQELSDSFVWMTGRLKEITAQTLQEVTKKQQIQYEMLELKYRALQSQISPHFICNILSSINAFTELEEPEKAGQLSVQAGVYLRENLKNIEQKYSTVCQEIRFADDYISLYRLVYGDTFEYHSQADPGLLDCVVPNMFLQPLVENCLVHGYEPGRPFSISVSVRNCGGRLKIEVADNGRGFDPQVAEKLQAILGGPDLKKPSASGFGIYSTIQRLELLYPQNHEVKIANAPGGGSVLTFLLPLAFSGPEA